MQPDHAPLETPVGRKPLPLAASGAIGIPWDVTTSLSAHTRPGPCFRNIAGLPAGANPRRASHVGLGAGRQPTRLRNATSPHLGPSPPHVSFCTPTTQEHAEKDRSRLLSTVTCRCPCPGCPTISSWKEGHPDSLVGDKTELPSAAASRGHRARSKAHT